MILDGTAMKTRKTLFLCSAVIAACLLLFACTEGGRKAIRVGDVITPFSGIDLDGRTFALGDHMGQPVIVRFFLLDCPYCKADTPTFNMFYSEYGPKGLKIVYINNKGANAEEVRSFARELNIDFPVIYDPEGKIAKQYNVRVQPLTLVLSPEHKLLAALLGGVSEAELNELLGCYLQ